MILWLASDSAIVLFPIVLLKPLPLPVLQPLLLSAKLSENRDGPALLVAVIRPVVVLVVGLLLPLFNTKYKLLPTTPKMSSNTTRKSQILGTLRFGFALGSGCCTASSVVMTVPGSGEDGLPSALGSVRGGKDCPPIPNGELL